MARWKKEGIFLKPLWKFRCRGCEDPLAEFTEMGYGLLNFPIYDDKEREYNSYALDRQYKCNLCGWQLNFGLALKKEHWEAIRERDEKEHRGQSWMEERSFTECQMK